MELPLMADNTQNSAQSARYCWLCDVNAEEFCSQCAETETTKRIQGEMFADGLQDEIRRGEPDIAENDSDECGAATRDSGVEKAAQKAARSSMGSTKQSEINGISTQQRGTVI